MEGDVHYLWSSYDLYWNFILVHNAGWAWIGVVSQSPRATDSNTTIESGNRGRGSNQLLSFTVQRSGEGHQNISKFPVWRSYNTTFASDCSELTASQLQKKILTVSVTVCFTHYILPWVLKARDHAVHLTGRCSSDSLRLDRDCSLLYMAKSSMCYLDWVNNSPSYWNHSLICTSIVCRMGHDCGIMAGMSNLDRPVPDLTNCYWDFLRPLSSQIYYQSFSAWMRPILAETQKRPLWTLCSF